MKNPTQPAPSPGITILLPADAALGFRLHEIRGLWSVTFPAR